MSEFKPVRCVKCGKRGSLVEKTTYTKGKKYRYFYVEHFEKGGKRTWCYIGKALPEEYKALRESDTQNCDTQTNDTQNDTQKKTLKMGSDSGKKAYSENCLRGGGSLRLVA